MVGHPATGKTTLARDLGGRLALPVFTKDDVKESLFDTLGVGDRDWSRRLGRASIALLLQQIEATLAAGGSAIGEANFDAQLAEPDLRAILERTDALAVVIELHAEPEVIVSRFTARADRHPGHLDAELADDVRAHPWSRYRPPAVGEIVSFDVSDPSRFDRLLDEVAQAIEIAAPQAAEHWTGQQPR